MRSSLFVALLLPTIAVAEPIESLNIITALTGDWNGDGGSDLALIVQTEPTEPMDVHFFVRDMDHNFLRPSETIRGQVYGEWNGHDRPGYEASDTEPELSNLPNGSIRLSLPALPVGSERLNQTLTLAYRGGTFIVAGFSYHYQDYLKENVGKACDYNVLTGKGVARLQKADGSWEEKTVSGDGQVVPFADWNPGTAFTACQQ